MEEVNNYINNINCIKKKRQQRRKNCFAKVFSFLNTSHFQTKQTQHNTHKGKTNINTGKNTNPIYMTYNEKKKHIEKNKIQIVKKIKK